MSDDGAAGEVQRVEQQAREQTGQRQIRFQVDEREMRTAYANFFRTSAMDDELMLDFGLNLPVPASQPNAQPEILLKVAQRVVMNYFTAKRLAISLSQLVRRHEQQFGELELDVAKRRVDGQGKA